MLSSTDGLKQLDRIHDAGMPDGNGHGGNVNLNMQDPVN